MEQSEGFDKRTKALEDERQQLDADISRQRQLLMDERQQLSELKAQQDAKLREIRELETSVFQAEVNAKESERALRIQQDTVAQLQRQTQLLHDQLIRDRDALNAREQVRAVTLLWLAMVCQLACWPTSGV